MSEAIVLNYTIPPDDFTRAGEASSDVKSKLKQLGVSPEAVRKVAIAMYEGEINMVIHAKGGEITVEIRISSCVYSRYPFTGFLFGINKFSFS